MTTREPLRSQHRIDRRVGLLQRHRNNDTLAGGEAVRLDHDRCAALRHVGTRFRRIVKRSVVRRRDAVPPHQRLGKIL